MIQIRTEVVWYRLADRWPAFRDREYLIASNGQRPEVAKWTPHGFDMNPHDVPGLQREQPQWWAALPETPGSTG